MTFVNWQLSNLNPYLLGNGNKQQLFFQDTPAAVMALNKPENYEEAKKYIKPLLFRFLEELRYELDKAEITWQEEPTKEFYAGFSFGYGLALDFLSHKFAEFQN